MLHSMSKIYLMEERPDMTASLSVSKTKKGDKWIPWYFVMFFLVIAAVDATFVMLAIKTQTGLVTDRAYEKGLAYNGVLNEAEAQRKLGIIHNVSYKSGKITWRLSTYNKTPVTDAKVRAKFFRAVQDGNDFELVLSDEGSGNYTAAPRFPLPGAWTARLEAQWQDSHSGNLRYNTTFDLIAP